ncbi:MAG: GNAT family N-acetyltransferase, partial [Candidatus Heimdallarchaeota archaeon]|nr:GNAT family N-acetyltransferase [Candidatus Heimdallarchaeota archaeon]
RYFDNLEGRAGDLEIRVMKFEYLKYIAEWPKFEEDSLHWANLPATTPELQQRWFSRQMSDTKIWFAVFQNTGQQDKAPRPENPILISRISLVMPVTGNDLILGIVVRSDMVNQGVGTKIIQMMLKIVFEKSDFFGVWLESVSHNKRAIHIWTKLGFELTGEHFRRNHYGKFELFKGFRYDRSKANLLPVVQFFYDE